MPEMSATLQEALTISQRLRRNRRNPSIRDLLRETTLMPKDLIAPIFVVAGENRQEPISSLPGVSRFSLDKLIPEVSHLYSLGIRGVALFPCLSHKTAQAEEAYNPEGLIPSVLRELKRSFPSMCFIADVALDPYTSHGHDGLVHQQKILNDPTVAVLCKMALVLAKAGADYVAPSDMMDGRVGAIRSALDRAGFEETGIIAYAAKYASSLYAPFREALQSNLAFGDKKSYQMDIANRREALREAKLDEEEGADILLVKPALPFLDILSDLRANTTLPLAAYQVSGEYSMICAAQAQGWLDAQAVFLETLTSIKRAGADLIFTYAAGQIAPLL